MKRYPTCRNIEIKTVNVDPHGLKITRLKFCTTLINGFAFSSDSYTEDGVPIIRIGDINPNINLGETKKVPVKFLKSHGSYKVLFGDILLALTGATIGKMMVYELEEEALLNQRVAIIRPSGEIANGYLKFVIGSRIFKEHIDFECVGGAQDNIGKPEIGEFRVNLPPLSLQRKISDYLDHKTKLIDTLIEMKQKQIELLQEQRAAIINQAVTKGLNPNVKMKDSRIEWLREIPEHWEIKAFKYYCEIAEGQVDPKDDNFKNVFLIAPNHIESGTGKLLFRETADEQGAISGKYRVKKGDIVYSKIRPALNKVCLALEDGLCSADMYPIRTKPQLMPKYLLYFFLSEIFVRVMVNESMRVAMPKINRDTLRNCAIPVPPLADQSIIIKSIDCETEKIFRLSEILRQTIERLKEYRTTLISEVVTGKIDVRDEAIP